MARPSWGSTLKSLDILGVGTDAEYKALGFNSQIP